MKVGLFVIATRRYREYLPQFVETARSNFLPNQKLEILLFSEESFPHTTWYPIEPLGWPDATLLRYQLFREIVFNRFDLLYYSDVDMRFEEPINDEVFPDNDSGLVAVQHPGFLSGEGSWETREESRAFVPSADRLIYFAGGFNGGSREAYRALVVELAADIEHDRQQGITAVWHDESHLNRYLAYHRPKILTPLYCHPEEYEGTGKITALLKDHDAMREPVARL